MPHLTFGLIEPHDAKILPQMVDGMEQFSGLNFKQFAATTMVARLDGRPVGFTAGQKGYGTQSHVFTLRGTYLCQNVTAPEILNDLKWALITYAADHLSVTQYKLNEQEDAKNISDGKPKIASPPPLEEESEDDKIFYEELNRSFVSPEQQRRFG